MNIYREELIGDPRRVVFGGAIDRPCFRACRRLRCVAKPDVVLYA
jgi:hypothetical protein